MTLPRRFVLRRSEDETGVSGTGDVAYGVLFSDDHVAVRWCVGEHRSTSVWTSLEAVEAIHGHGGLTEIVWADPPVPTDRPHELSGDCWCEPTVVSVDAAP